MPFKNKEKNREYKKSYMRDYRKKNKEKIIEIKKNSRISKFIQKFGFHSDNSSFNRFAGKNFENYKKYLSMLPLTQEQQQSLVFLGGIISTDGCIHKNAVQVAIYSCERDWLIKIKKKCKKLNLKTKIKTHKRSQKKTQKNGLVLIIYKPFFLYCLLREVEDWIIPRKFDILKEKYSSLFDTFEKFTKNVI